MNTKNKTNTMTHPDDSILNSEWVAPTRPYSRKELEHLHDRLFRSYRLSSLYVIHESCGHQYYVKENGMKYKNLKENNTLDTGKCSVCWKLRQTPRSLKGSAIDFIDLYAENFPDLESPVYTYYRFEIERIFYTWLYQEYY